jgi:hypothetical protein
MKDYILLNADGTPTDQRLSVNLILTNNVPSENCDILVDLHFLKALAYRDIENTSDLAELKQLGTLLTAIEFGMQQAWNFPINETYHVHGLRNSKCTCPKIDNFESLGYCRIVSGDCPLHGE